MSFSSDAKAELCQQRVEKRALALAECYGVLLYGHSFSPREIRLITGSEPFAQRLPRLFSRAFSLSFDSLPEPGERGKRRFLIEDREKLRTVFEAFGVELDGTLSHHINFGILEEEGYQTAFFHGAQRGSMGFMAFARSTGFQDYYGREDYEADRRFGGHADFDGTWAIWDEPFLQYYVTKMTEMKQPFMTAVFTASSHHPYAVPDKYKSVYPEEGIAMHKCIRYTDMALGKFFAAASRQPWFHNTIFVLTSDHTNMSDHPEYQTDLGGFCSPIIIYEPGVTDLHPEVQQKIAQQIDLLPTLMNRLHYPKPYFAFGIDVLNTPAEDTWAVNYLNGSYQYVKHGYVLQFDGHHTKAVYALSDSLMQHNLLEESKAEANSSLFTLHSSFENMETELKSIIQQYMSRMTTDRLQP